MSTEGILLNHSGLSNGSSRPVGGISTFEARSLPFPTLSQSDTFQVHNINNKPYFTIWNKNTETVDFYEFNSSNNELKKINSIYNIPKNQKYKIYLFSFKNTFYCCITPRAGYAGQFLLYLDTSKNIWKEFTSQNLVSNSAITSAVEIDNVLYITQYNEIYKTTNLTTLTEIHSSSNYNKNYYVAKIANQLITFEFNNDGHYINIYLGPSMEKMSDYSISGSEKMFFWNLPNEIYLCTSGSSSSNSSIAHLFNFDFTKKTYFLKSVEENVYGLNQFFFLDKDDLFYIKYLYEPGTVNSPYFRKAIRVSKDEAFPFHQYLLKGNKIIVEDTDLIKIYSSNVVIKNKKIIEITEDGEVYLLLYRIDGNYQNFLIF